MRVFYFALIASFAVLGAAPAFASDADVLKQFGILGTLAVNCGEPVSQENPYLVFAVDAAGQATRTLRTGGTAIDATLKMRNLRLVRDDLLEYDETGRSSELKTSIAKLYGKYRGWNTVRTSGPESGTVLVENGISKATGKPTVAFTFCEAD